MTLSHKLKPFAFKRSFFHDCLSLIQIYELVVVVVVALIIGHFIREV